MTEKLGRYHARRFDRVEWTKREITVIATSETQVRSHVDSLCLPEYRIQPLYNWEKRPGKDSLIIGWIEEITLPCEI